MFTQIHINTTINIQINIQIKIQINKYIHTHTRIFTNVCFSEEIAMRTDDFTGSDLRELVRVASLQVL